MFQRFDPCQDSMMYEHWDQILEIGWSQINVVSEYK